MVVCSLSKSCGAMMMFAMPVSSSRLRKTQISRTLGRSGVLANDHRSRHGYECAVTQRRQPG